MSDDQAFPDDSQVVDEGNTISSGEALAEIVFANSDMAVMPSAAIIHSNETFQVQWCAYNIGQADSAAFVDNLTIYSVPSCPGSDDELVAVWNSDVDGNWQDFQQPPLAAQSAGSLMQPTVGPFPAGCYRLVVTLNSGGWSAEQDLGNNSTYNCIEILEAEVDQSGSSDEQAVEDDQGGAVEGQDEQFFDGEVEAEMADFLDNDPDELVAEADGGDDELVEGGAPAPPDPACLAGVAVPLAFTTPARDLTRLEARDIVVYLIAQGAFTLKQSQTPLTFDAQCRVLQPQPSTRVTIAPAVIDGVRFVYRGDPRIDVISNLDLRLVVLLYRLARMLRETWGVTEIHHLGIGHGRGGADDCHNTGRAMDFAGVVGEIVNAAIPSANGPYQLDILNDWGRQPVTMPNGTTRANWPGDFTQTSYRLDPVANYPAEALFRNVYEFATLNCSDTSTQRNSNTAGATTIGRASRFILHPDYPNPAAWGRPAHQNHIHMQIGPTGAETSPP